MNFEEVYVENIKEYIDIVFSCDGDIVYRGVSDTDYPLIPGIGRKLKGAFDKRQRIILESEMLTEFFEKIASIEHCSNYTELAILAQHYGMPTRLLDWTGNPLVALYFSIKSNFTKDSAVYIADIANIPRAYANFDYSTFVYQGGTQAITELVLKDDSFAKLADDERAYTIFEHVQKNFKDNNFIVITPKAKTQRVIAQDSIFIFHADPFIPFDKYIVKKIIIKKEIKYRLMYYLNKLGFHDFSMFPDCDGLCSYLKNKYLF